MRYEDIKIGDVFRFDRLITESDVQSFAKLTGDYNPLHTDPEYAKGTQFKKSVAHGMLLAGLFSTLVGMHCPKDNCLYLSQTLQFKIPVFFGDTVTVKGIVESKNDSVRLITIKTFIYKNEHMAVFGEAKVKII